MIDYRQATENDFDLTYTIKKNATKDLIDKIWVWDNSFQLDYHRKQFNPARVNILIDNNHAAGFIAVNETERTIFIENILIDTAFQGKGIGTQVLMDLMEKAFRQNKNIELQVLRVNERAKKFYDRLGFEVVEETDLHYKMSYGQRN